MKGTANLACAWAEELWMPVTVPAMTQQIQVVLWDHDKLTKNDKVGTAFLSFKDVKETAKTRWVNIYGACCHRDVCCCR